MKVVIRTTGILAWLLSAVCSKRAQPQRASAPPPTLSTPPEASDRQLEQIPVTPVGVQVVMSDGSVQTYPLGVWLTFQDGLLRAVMPTQYVNQIATVQANKTWKYTRAGRNVQVWRNGLLQREGPDYSLNQAGMTITPKKYKDSNGVEYGWNDDDYVTVAYLF